MEKSQKRTARVVLVMLATAALAVMLTMASGGSASAQPQDPYASESPTVLPSLIRKSAQHPSDDVLNTRQERGALPFTGADLSLFVATGLAAIGTGVVVVRRTRSKDDDAA